MKSKECQTGCISFTGGEIRHHKDCVFYPESLTELYDNLKKEIQELKEENKDIRSQINEDYEEIKSLRDENKRLKNGYKELKDLIRDKRCCGNSDKIGHLVWTFAKKENK